MAILKKYLAEFLAYTEKKMVLVFVAISVKGCLFIFKIALKRQLSCSFQLFSGLYNLYLKGVAAIPESHCYDPMSFSFIGKYFIYFIYLSASGISK